MKPCPFCGGQGEFHDDDFNTAWWITCQSCEADGPIYQAIGGRALPTWERKEWLVLRWNHRWKVGRERGVFQHEQETSNG